MILLIVQSNIHVSLEALPRINLLAIVSWGMNNFWFNTYVLGLERRQSGEEKFLPEGRRQKHSRGTLFTFLSDLIDVYYRYYRMNAHISSCSATFLVTKQLMIYVYISKVMQTTLSSDCIY